MIDPTTATLKDIEAWKVEKHLGSPTSILFLTKDQRQLQREKKVLLLADYSTGGSIIKLDITHKFKIVFQL